MTELALAAAWGSALALGREPALPPPASWEPVLQVLVAERLLPLAWTRGGATMRRILPAAAVDGWRARALLELSAGERRAARALSIVRLLRGGGVPTILLRGPGLSERLYGSPALRPGGDVDLFVAEQHWPEADALLRGAEWVREYGRPPAESAYRRAGERGFAVEVHCALDDSPLMRHLALPAPEWSERSLGGTVVRVHDGPLLPAYLAAHAAKHVLPPLLWFVDIHELWSSLDDAGRAAARTAARHRRLERFLDWGLACAEAISALAGGDLAATTRLGFAGERRRDVHNAWRVATLSARPSDALHVALAWAIPPDDRRPSAAAVRRLAGRAGKRLAAVVRKERSYGPAGAPPGALALDEPLHRLARDVMAHGGALWIRATGDSMRPAIAPGARVRLVPPCGASTVRPGAVVLARLPSGVTVLHRVISVDGRRVTLAGDNMPAADPATTLSEVVAVADLVDHRGQVRPVGTRRRGSVRRARRVVARAARMLGRSAPEVQP